jgi:hypothetical protein
LRKLGMPSGQSWSRSEGKKRAHTQLEIQSIN